MDGSGLLRGIPESLGDDPQVTPHSRVPFRHSREPCLGQLEAGGGNPSFAPQGLRRTSGGRAAQSTILVEKHSPSYKALASQRLSTIGLIPFSWPSAFEAEARYCCEVSHTPSGRDSLTVGERSDQKGWVLAPIAGPNLPVSQPLTTTLLYIAGNVFLALVCAVMLSRVDKEAARLYRLTYNNNHDDDSDKPARLGKMKRRLRVFYGLGLALMLVLTCLQVIALVTVLS